MLVMNRLPCCDRATLQLEFAVFARPAFSVIVMVALAAAQMTTFMAGSDRMTAALAGQTEPLAVATAAMDNRNVATKVSGPADSRAAPRNHAIGKIRSVSDSAVSLLLR